ncbi:ArsC family reductase [Paraglaciecola sp. L3A3]|uniref:ArsC family reductase n=1 Tax=Paraglaciecola sp. L3A3 TaxID=2686358 RepID=UPI00131E9565|nr:ArsC family reductase [Paraglaciecola sp. L3A3]
MTTLYGIKNCDSIKKAKTWLTNNNIEFTYHDYRQDGLDIAWLTEAEQNLGWEVLLNKRGTTFRQLSEQQKQNLDQASAIALMLEQPAMIKRPVLIHQGQYFIGFKAEQYEEILL